VTEYRRILLEGSAVQVVRHGDTLVTAAVLQVDTTDGVHPALN
jgi:hypothetical protein